MEGGKVPASDPALRRGIDFLLRTQLADGTWHVRTRAHPFQPPMDSGFPHGRDGWISAAGTELGRDGADYVAGSDAECRQRHWPVARVRPPLCRRVCRRCELATPAPRSVEFTRDIQPLLERSCVACHSGEEAEGRFQVIDRALSAPGWQARRAAVVPGKPDASPLLRFVQDQVEDLEMPPVGKREKFPALTKDEIAKLNDGLSKARTGPQARLSTRRGNDTAPLMWRHPCRCLKKADRPEWKTIGGGADGVSVSNRLVIIRGFNSLHPPLLHIYRSLALSAKTSAEVQ